MRANVGGLWKENKAQRECLVATPADVVCESSHNVALHSRSTRRKGVCGPRLKELHSKIMIIKMKTLPSSPCGNSGMHN